MMATEATPEILATSSTLPDHELNTTETSSQDVSSEQPLLNGTPNPETDKDEIKQYSEHVEPGVNSADISVSGGSDTEASKAETTKTQTDEKGHNRSTSTVKKFASFKPVSVNKTFLAAKGATTAAPSKLGDKPAASTTIQAGPSASTVARPRLVAKSGSGLRDSTPRASAAANGSKPGGAPDASAVWNKNRPAPPPEPKRFTDEELKQRYGIHLATRLQTDDGGKEKNWADIDDDDDDWAPETIEWTDGTKITLPQADDTPVPIPEPIPTPISVLKDVKPAALPKSKSPAPSQPTASPTVKPTGLGSGRTGLVLKGASEKPTLVAKPPGPPTPVKSPWAPVSVTPVAIETHQEPQPPPSRFNTNRDPHGFQAMPPPPAKEIAADDFSRSWRDGNVNPSRELYNSQSGRYEPVNDNRRGSARGDPHSRQPAVLQRPSQDGPAEPSAAFQTHRATGQDPGYGRRRTSSNVSGGSGAFARRMSRGHEMPPHEMLNVRRGSLAAVSDAPSSPRNFSPSGQQQPPRGYQNQAWQSHASPVNSQPSPQSAHGQVVPPAPANDQSAPTSAVPSDDQVFQEQKQRMREKRELAIKRRQDEEAKEEAERKERIRIKLEAMGPAPDSKKNKKETPKIEKAVPTAIQSRVDGDLAPATNKAEAIQPSTESTVNISRPVRDSDPTNSNAVNSKPPEKTFPNHRPNGINQGEQSHSVPVPVQQAPYQNKVSQPWQNNSTSTSWAPPPTQQSASNVWGPPPTNNKALGNGAFNPELNRLPDMHATSRPGPIGPPNMNRGNYYPQGRGSEYGRARPAPIGPPHRDLTLEQDKHRAQNSQWSMATELVEGSDNAIREKVEKEKAARRELEERGEAPEIYQPAYHDKWVEAKVENNSRTVTGKVHNAVHDPVGQTDAAWRANAVKAPEGPEDAHRHQFDAVGNGPQQNTDKWRSGPSNAAAQAPRGSRFFPAQDVRLEEHGYSFDRPGSPSPPPPTMAGHPAYDGDSRHPIISLPPPDKPNVVVKLPPAPPLAPIGPPRPTSFAAAVSTPAAPPANNAPAFGRQDYATRAASSYQDARRTAAPPAPETAPGGWQDRINSLIGRKQSPPKSHAFAVDSSSKSALELPQSQSAATVSLPSLASDDSVSTDESTISKPAAEECFEEQEMGSLPVIKVPSHAPQNGWHLATPPKTLPRKFLASQVTSREPHPFPESSMNNRTTILVKLTAISEAHILNLKNQPRHPSSPRRGSARGGASRHTSSTHPRGGRGRDTARGGLQSSTTENGTASSNHQQSSGRGGRGTRGGYRSNNTSSWDTHVSTPTPVHT